MLRNVSSLRCYGFPKTETETLRKLRKKIETRSYKCYDFHSCLISVWRLISVLLLSGRRPPVPTDSRKPLIFLFMSVCSVFYFHFWFPNFLNILFLFFIFWFPILFLFHSSPFPVLFSSCSCQYFSFQVLLSSCLGQVRVMSFLSFLISSSRTFFFHMVLLHTTEYDRRIRQKSQSRHVMAGYDRSQASSSWLRTIAEINKNGK